MSGLDGKIIQANRRAAEMLGLENAEELIGESGYDLVVPEEREEFQRRLTASFKNGVSEEIEFTFVGQGGLRRTGGFIASILADAQGKPRTVMTTVRDITKRKQAERQLQSLASQLSLAEERERRLIATELHDNVGQILATAKMKLGALKRKYCKAGLEDAVGEVKKLCEQAIAFTRSLTFQLSPPVLYELCLEAALEWLTRGQKEQHGIDIEFASDREPKPLDGDIRVLLFQSVRELLNNVARHARASKLTVSVSRESDKIRISVEDNGAGFDTSAQNGSSGFGLFNIRERLVCLGGSFSLQSSPGQGTRVVLAAPLKNEETGGP